MSEDRVAQRGVGYPRVHRNLHGSHDLRGADAKGRKAKDAIAVGFDQSLQKSSRFGKGSRAKDCFHGNFKHTVGDAFCLSFLFI